MSKRKGSTPRRKDNDFDRNGRLLIPREGINTTNVERQLFDPRSDHPITFNKSAIKKEELQVNSSEKRQSPVSPQFSRRELQSSDSSTFTRRPLTSGRQLWNGKDDNLATQSSKKERPRAAVSEVTALPPTVAAKEPVKKRLPPPEVIKKNKHPSPLTEEDAQKKIQRKQWKLLIASLREIENKLEAVTATSRSLPCFNEDNNDQAQQQRNILNETHSEDQPLLVEQDVLDAESIWKDKIQLHLALGEKYLEILRCDLEYSEKKGLESLCWKRAIYSLVDQFRRALKKSTTSIATATTPNTLVNDNAPQSELASMLFDEGQGEVTTEIPIIHQGGGMTFVKVEKPKPDKAKENDNALQIKQAQMTLALFLQYLDLADNFYLQLSLFLKSVDDDIDSEMEIYLNQWRRTKRFKWYNCISLRGDLARYRWAYTPEEVQPSNIVKELNDELNNEEMSVPLQGSVTTWTKKEAFEEAWKRYYLGIWLMPAKGNLYFNLSLLLQQPHPQFHTQGHEFHKLYLSTRSLMVRRNAFLNARESMLALFEGNRRWIQKYIEPSTNSNPKLRTKRNKSTTKSDILVNKDVAIPALFVRLHGMLFTKIGLDEFSKMKRAFFDTLFKSNHTQLKDQPIAFDTQKPFPSNQLSGAHFFWFEMIILCLSSLYTYDYANSKLTKLISSHTAKLFYPDTSNDQQYQSLVENLGESILFAHEIDLTCQIAVELFQRYIDRLLPLPNVPKLPRLPDTSLEFNSNKDFLFGAVQDQDGKRIHHNHHQSELNEPLIESDDLAWLVYIEILLHWMVLNGICIRTANSISLWESLVGDIGYDLINHQQSKQFTLSNDHRSSKISPAFWPLLLQFLNKLLNELPDEDKYDMINKHLLDDEDVAASENNSKFSDSEYAFAKNIVSILGLKPDLPEEEQLRGLGWVDEVHGRFLKIEPDVKENHTQSNKFDIITRRKIKILEYGFTLVKHLEDILYYDPVEEIFTVSKTAEERAFALDEATKASQLNLQQQVQSDLLSEEEDLIVGTTIAEMDDDVLLSCETDLDEQQNEGDDIMTQLKKRREQLQSIVATAEAEERFGYRRLPARAKEREARLNYLRKCIIPGKTILVLDTNCFIGHIDHVKKLLQAQAWSIIVPLVVVTELDGLRTNPQRLGLVAQQGIQLLEATLAAKPKQSTSLRIQTSHNNFMNDISIRSEQFVFGESDKNLDDLILSSCLWWIAQHGPKDQNDKVVPVCLVTGDRNLSVKARARDVEVVPVSAIIQLTPTPNNK